MQSAPNNRLTRFMLKGSSFKSPTPIGWGFALRKRVGFHYWENEINSDLLRSQRLSSRLLAARREYWNAD
jgi:hypothetical protein